LYFVGYLYITCAALYAVHNKILVFSMWNGFTALGQTTVMTTNHVLLSY